jgi:flavin reductase (DIM6/NTAB) family NADH-FMN oxidoreductase RutF
LHTTGWSGAGRGSHFKLQSRTSLTNSSRPRPPLDSASLRAAFSSFATGVTVITAIDEHGTAVGMTANSFGSVSLDPPLVQWSLRINSGLHRAFVQASHFSVSVLASDQEAVARQFASRAPERFEGVALVEWRDVSAVIAIAPPLIDGALAHFVCKKINDYRVGDHELFIGEVLRAQTYAAVVNADAHSDAGSNIDAGIPADHRAHERTPLIFFGSKFSKLRR